MECVEFEGWTSDFINGNVTSAALKLDYIAAIFITYTRLHILGDFPYRIGRKMF